MILQFPETGKATTVYIRAIGYRARCANLPAGSCHNLAQNIVEFVDGIGRPVAFVDGVDRDIPRELCFAHTKTVAAYAESRGLKVEDLRKETAG
jgi:hypothetical protein